jgi:hypothetical protein
MVRHTDQWRASYGIGRGETTSGEPSEALELGNQKGPFCIVGASLECLLEGPVSELSIARPVCKFSTYRKDPMIVRQGQLKIVQEHESCTSTVCFGDSHGSVQADNGGSGEHFELEVQPRNLCPVCVVCRRCLHMFACDIRLEAKLFGVTRCGL